MWKVNILINLKTILSDKNRRQKCPIWYTNECQVIEKSGLCVYMYLYNTY